MVSNIRLQKFRSYDDSSFEFEDGVNIIVGPNASGKTNLLEAISVVCRGKTFRNKENSMVRFGEEWSRIDAYVSDSNRSVKIKNENERQTKEYVVDEKNFKRLTKRYYLPVVVFEPNHLLLLQGQPEGRRNYIDEVVGHADINYSKLIKDYRKTLIQRNTLLKSGRKDSAQMFVWNVRLSEQGSKIAGLRRLAVDEINSIISDVYSGIADKRYKVDFTYASSCNNENYASSMMTQLERKEAADYQRGFTSCGPHRDDVVITIDDKLSSQTASRGEARTMLLALKMHEVDVIEKRTNRLPVLLLDDVFSELDGSRRKALTGCLRLTQSFITTTDADILTHRLVSDTNTIMLQ